MVSFHLMVTLSANNSGSRYKLSMQTVWLSNWNHKGWWCHTECRFSLYVGICTNKVFNVFREKQTGLNEGEEWIDFLQVILNGSACQQHSKTHCKLRKSKCQMAVNSRGKLKNWQAGLGYLSGVLQIDNDNKNKACLY